MRIVAQRVTEASVKVKGRFVGKIGRGLLIFLGVARDDDEKDIEFLAGKVAQLRIFEDKAGKMNLSALETGAEFLVVSQFTLLGDCSKGRRPSFDKAAEPKKAEDYYNRFIEELRRKNFKVETGRFRAMMDVALINDGPVTFVIESQREASLVKKDIKTLHE